MIVVVELSLATRLVHAMELMDVNGDDDTRWGVVADGAADAVDAVPEMLMLLQPGCDAQHVCQL